MFTSETPHPPTTRNNVTTSNNLATSRRRRLYGKNKNSKRKIYKRKVLDFKKLFANNIVHNLSSYKLTYNQIKVLNKGLGFAPSHIPYNFTLLTSDFLKFERRLQLFLHFANTPTTDVYPPQRRAFESNPDWWPKRLNPFITDLCYKLKRLVFRYVRKPVRRNLTPAEIKALRDLKLNPNIVIKKADKGGGIAIFDRDKYEMQIHSMLEDVNTYTPVERDDSFKVKSDADKILQNLFDQTFLNAKQLRHLTKFTPVAPTFYGIPKIHKLNCPLRPIVSQIHGPTSGISLLVDKLLFVAEQSIPFLLQDTTAYLKFIDSHKNVSSNTFLVTMDVTSLYTNIPHEEGIQLVADFYAETLPLWENYKTEILPIPVHTLKVLIEFILKNCTFEFCGSYFKQNFGTTMGASFSVKYANIYMFQWFRKYLQAYSGIKPDKIARLIDDCFFTWDNSENDLKLLQDHLNTCHNSIKFEITFSKERVSFLDTITYIEDDTIKTRLYTKPTDKKQYLHYYSYHPRHIFSSIPYSQSIRYRRIIDSNEIYLSELRSLEQKFITRGYPKHILTEAFDKASQKNVNQLRNYRSAADKRSEFLKFLKGRSFIPLILPYHTLLTSKQFKAKFDHVWYQFCHVSPPIATVFQNEKPQIVFKRRTTINNLLIRTKLTPKLSPQDRSNIALLQVLSSQSNTVKYEVTRCSTPRCKCCTAIVCDSSYSDFNNSTTFYIEQNFNCNSHDIIYVIHCNKCNIQYVGQSSRKLKERLNNHRSDIICKKNTAIALHFNLPQHSVNNLRIMPISSLSTLNTAERSKKELFFMKLLDTFYPKGLNFYPLI